MLVDCDGTLLDTNYLHTLAWSRALRSLGTWAPMNAIHRLVGMGGDQLVPELLGHDLDGADEAHDRHYGELHAEACAVPGRRRTLLRRCTTPDSSVVLASSASADGPRDMREVLDADDAIDARSTPTTSSDRSPIRRSSRSLVTSAGIDPALVLAVGDSVWDVRAAARAGMGCVAVESGGFGRHELAEAGAVAVYRDVEELGDQMMTSPIGTLVAARATSALSESSPAAERAEAFLRVGHGRVRGLRWRRSAPDLGGSCTPPPEELRCRPTGPIHRYRTCPPR